MRTTCERMAASVEFSILRCKSTDLAVVLGVLGQEVFKRKNLVPHTLENDMGQYMRMARSTRANLDVVKLVAPDDELFASVTLLEGLHPLSDLRILPREGGSGSNATKPAYITTNLFAFNVWTSIPIGNTPTSTNRSSS